MSGMNVVVLVEAATELLSGGAALRKKLLWEELLFLLYHRALDLDFFFEQARWCSLMEQEILRVYQLASRWNLRRQPLSDFIRDLSPETLSFLLDDVIVETIRELKKLGEGENVSLLLDEWRRSPFTMDSSVVVRKVLQVAA